MGNSLPLSTVAGVSKSPACTSTRGRGEALGAPDPDTDVGKLLPEGPAGCPRHPESLTAVSE